MQQLDIVRDAHVFPRTGNRPFAVVAARVETPDDVQRVVDAVAHMPGESYIMTRPRWLVIVDEDAEIRDHDDLLWRFTLAVRPEKDVIVRHTPSSWRSDIPMLVIDATFKNKPEMDWGPGVGAGAEPPVAKTTPEMVRRVEARWKEYGLE
jgi:3-polyprenyl-4-hydroxybenzoate decarboxylase